MKVHQERHHKEEIAKNGLNAGIKGPNDSILAITEGDEAMKAITAGSLGLPAPEMPGKSAEPNNNPESNPGSGTDLNLNTRPEVPNMPSLPKSFPASTSPSTPTLPTMSPSHPPFGGMRVPPFGGSHTGGFPNLPFPQLPGIPGMGMPFGGLPGLSNMHANNGNRSPHPGLNGINPNLLAGLLKPKMHTAPEPNITPNLNPTSHMPHQHPVSAAAHFPVNMTPPASSTTPPTITEIKEEKMDDEL